MTKEEKLLSMLQPKSYKSKIRLYCNIPYFKIQGKESISCEKRDFNRIFGWK